MSRRSQRGQAYSLSMSEKDFEDNIKILALGLRSGESVGSMPNINLYLRKIKQAYKIVLNKVSQDEPLYEAERWLYENYYVATIDVKQSDYKAFTRLTHKKNNVRIIQLARFLVSSANCSLSKEYISKGLALFNSYTPLHYEETLNLKKALDYALIEKIAIVVKQITQMERLKRHAKRNVEPVKRLCKYDAYLYYFKHFGKYLDEKYFYKINDINLDNIDVSFSNNLVDMSVSIANCITSIKALKDIFDDKFTIEQCSIYSIMAQDEIFRDMDICSQYAYMSAVGKLSTLYGASERSVAKSAMKLSKKFNVHFGEIIYDYRYAIKADLHSLAPQILQKPTTKPDQRLYAVVVALLSIALTTLSIIFLPTWRYMVGVGVIMFFASIPLARFIIALIVDYILPSRSVASMNYKKLPKEGKTLIVKCEYITSAKQAKEARDNLLDLALTNKDEMLEYSLLVDLKSSKSQVDEADKEIYQVFDEMSKYDKVNVFVRSRSNIGGVWKAYERKRGATNTLNNALISGDWQDFSYVLRKQEKPNFVLLLDEDNTLMPGAIKRAVNTMLHPLNAKYTLLTFSSRYKLSSLTTLWTKRYALDSGVDSYCNYGDFYYKISGNAIYCGKGIYRLDEYVEKLQGKLPDGKILSHDIVEGAIVSAGSLSVPTFEDAPTGLVSHVVRQNRWQRGDILLFPYIFSKKVTQPFYRYVMAYNIVKTILPICQFVLLSMLILTGQLWLLLPFAISFAGVYLIRFGLCLNALNYGKRMRYVLRQFVGEVGEMIFDFITLPFEAVQCVLLWLKMIFKLIFDRKNLLEWKTFYSTQRGNTFSKHLGLILPSCILSIILAGVFFKNIAFLTYIAVFVIFIMATYLLSIKREKKSSGLKAEDNEFLRSLANSTLKYFERNMDEKSLICDNYQVFPRRGANSFTSPTNIGFALLSIICAYKLENISQDEALQKLRKQISAIEGLDKYEGHLYNWYSLATQKPLYPYFVSSVDSGNFIACLICVKSFVKDIDENLGDRVARLIEDCDFDALFDNSKGKFFIGYNKEQNKYEGHYDMLASEARTLCYIASALKGNTAYFNGLSRNIIKLKGNTLVSWSGTAFEYLMPQIFMSDCSNSLLTKSCRNIVDIMAKSKCGDVWGISESCYFEFNEENSYKYSAFGVSRISLSAAKDRCVISPYSSALAIKYAPAKAVKNLKKLADLGLKSSMGMYEAIDFTNGNNIVATLMSHHQGMLLCSIVNALFDDYIVKLFMSDHAMSGGKLMLEEKMPTHKSKSTKKFDAVYDAKTSNAYRRAGECGGFPIVNALTNGHYSVVGNSHGGGYSFAKGKYIDKFSGDIYENKGSFFYVDDGNELYCPTYAPKYEHKCDYSFSPFENTFVNRDKNCQMSVYIPQHLNCEVRKITLTNSENSVKKYTCGFCGELALNDFGGMTSHPAFNDMFISTLYDERLDSLIAKRSARSIHGDCYASLTVLGADKLEYESNLANFIGREGTFASPRIFKDSKRVGVSIGDVLNPCLGFVGELTLNPAESKSVYCIISYESDLNALKSNVEQIRSTDFVKYAYESAKLTALSKTYKYQLSDKISDLICRLSTRVLYVPYDRVKCSEISSNFISSLPMSLDKAVKYIYFGYYNQDEKLKNLIYSIIYMNMASIKCNLVVAYAAKDRERELILKSFIELTNIGDLLNLNCLRFLNTEGMDSGVIEEIKRNAFIVLDNLPKKGDKGEDNFSCVSIPILEKGENMSKKSAIYGRLDANIVKPCSVGGFDIDGNYIVTTTPDLPYSNVICGERGGFVVTQNGGGFDYFDNSNLCRATKFENNPIFDTACEEIYADLGGMQRLNKLNKGGFVKHGVGYTQFCGIVNQVEYCVEEGIIKDGSGKYVKIKLSKEKGEIDTQIIFCLNAMLGDLPINQMLFDEQIDYKTVKVTNAYNNQSVFIRCDAGADLLPAKASFKGLGGEVYLSEFKGDSNLASHAFATKKFSGKDIEINVVIAKDYNFISSLKWESLNDYILEQKFKFADLNKFELCSKDKNLNLFFNKWLAYQVVSSRINGRCGYYQAGGAIGFRDQLQDMLTMLYIDTERVKKHILLSAEHQYLEGDVQHWWHNDCFGVRTHISDDRLFLPLVTFEYIDFTGDSQILNSIQKYLVSPPLEDRAESRLEVPQKSSVGESLLSHIKRAIDATLKYGERGLLLIGGGDWNDALNEIGMQNKGESVWLSMLALYVLRKFVKYLDFDRRQEYLAHIENLQLALDKCVKDGYFMRATTDLGEELGVKSNARFTKDILCQSWSVIASVSSKSVQNTALQSVSDLIDPKAGIIKLLAPAQSKEAYYGYISSYPKGVRENGGQYTHASAWYVKAVAINGVEIDVDGKKYTAHNLLDMLNPISKNSTQEGADRYKGEPYVLAGDVYSNEDNYGRMGWSWYSGSASILYNALVRDFMGISIQGKTMSFTRPKLDGWQGMSVTYKYKGTIYLIEFDEDTEDCVEQQGVRIKGDTAISLEENLGKRSVKVLFAKQIH